MEKFDTILNSLMYDLRKEREIGNPAQALEVISIFILVRFLEVVILGNNNGLSSRWELNKFSHIKPELEEIIRNGVERGNFSSDSFNLSELLIQTLRGVLTRLESSRSHYSLIEFIKKLDFQNDFNFIACSYSKLLDGLFLESPQFGVWCTPHALREFIVSYIKPQNGEQIYDPACGTSGLLIQAALNIEKNKPGKKVFLHGKEISHFAILLSMVNLCLNLKDNFKLTLGDSLVDLYSSHESGAYDVIITNPPFGKAARETSCVFPELSKNIDCQFLYHAMLNLKDGGRAAIILPERFLFDSSESGIVLRERLFNEFNVECIVALPPGAMLPYTGVKIIILFFKRSDATKSVWFYQLNILEKLTKRNNLTTESFEDFFIKEKARDESENSWNIDLTKLVRGFNLLEYKPSRREVSDVNFIFKASNEIENLNGELLENISIVTEKIASIKSKLASKLKNATFKKYKVDDLVHSLGTKPLSRDLLHEKGQFKVYGGNGIIGYHDEYLHSGIFIIVGRVGALCGNVHYVEGKIWATNNSVILCVSDLANVNPRYLARILKNKNLRELATGTAQPHLSVAAIKKTEVHLPSLDIQFALEEVLVELEEAFLHQSTLFDQLKFFSKNLNDDINKHLTFM
uniref:N-6 DNA methylase n=1 Tax=Cellvibrio fontiphilus TaxID=1815559 RepID=UPI002B4BC369|nr:N-6 DNA methylase [Cellvibrio fontiphilus]